MKNIVFTGLFLLLLVSCKENQKGQKPENSTSTSGKDTTAANGQKPEQNKELLIVPGKRLGDLYLGKEATVTLKDSLGEPLHQDSAMGKSSQTFRLKNKDLNGNDAILSIFTAIRMDGGNTDGKHRLQAVRTNSTTFATEQGLKVGSTFKEIQHSFKLQKLGEFTKNGNTYSLYDTEDGIAFEVNKDKICSGIEIHKADTKATDSYLPVYEHFKGS